MKHQAAFPSPGVIIPGLDPNARQQGAYEGMTLRDYFAAKAAAGICASKDEAGVLLQHGAEWIASEAYRIADALMSERLK